MSGPLLLGIAAVGVGWAWVHRHPTSTPGPTHVVIDPGATPGATVGDSVSQPSLGLAAVAGAVADAAPAKNIGDVAIAGTDGGPVVPVEFTGPDGQQAIVASLGKSVGGADPSTLTTAIHTGTSVDAAPVHATGDAQATILDTLWGPGGAAGMTKAQVNDAYQSSANWTNEVF